MLQLPASITPDRWLVQLFSARTVAEKAASCGGRSRTWNGWSGGTVFLREVIAAAFGC